MVEREFIIDNIFYKKSLDVPEYFDIVIESNGSWYDFYCGNLKIRNELPDLNQYEQIDGIDILKKKYGKLKITEFRYEDASCNSYLLISDNFLFISDYKMDGNFEVAPQRIWIVDEIRDFKNREIYESYLQKELVSDWK